jgi:hypothetical protein
MPPTTSINNVCLEKTIPTSSSNVCECSSSYSEDENRNAAVVEINFVGDYKPESIKPVEKIPLKEIPLEKKSTTKKPITKKTVSNNQPKRKKLKVKNKASLSL